MDLFERAVNEVLKSFKPCLVRVWSSFFEKVLNYIQLYSIIYAKENYIELYKIITII